MRRLAFALLVLAAALAARAQAPLPSPHAIEIPSWFTETFLDFREDVRDAAREGKRVMIYFGQDGCPYCKALMQVDFGQPDIVAKTRANFVAIALNLWGDREATWFDGRTMSEKDLARALNVQFTPTLLFLDEKGGIALRLNGYLPPERFRIALDYAADRGPKKEPFTDYLAKRLAATPATRGAAGAFVGAGPPDFPAVLKRGRPVIALFEYDGCADCEEMRREGFARPEVKALLDRFSVVRVELAGARTVVTPDGRPTDERRFARAMNVVYTPTLLFLDGAGKEVFRSEGYLKPFHLASTLDYVASGAYRREPSFQRYIQERADRMRAKGQAVEIWE